MVMVMVMAMLVILATMATMALTAMAALPLPPLTAAMNLMHWLGVGMEIAGLWLAAALVTDPLAGRWLRGQSAALGHVCRFDGEEGHCRECGRAGFVEERLERRQANRAGQGPGQPERPGQTSRPEGLR